MRTTIVFTEPDFNEVSGALALEVESAAVLLANRVTGPGGDLTLLVTAVRWTPETAYVTRTDVEMVIEADGWYPAVAESATKRLTPIFLHTHPRGRATLSARDHIANDALEGPFRARAGVTEFVSLVVGGDPDAPEVAGETRTADGSRHSLRAVRSVGDRLRILLPCASATTDPAPAFDRQILAFGADGQRLLGAMRVGVAGVGGTGSAVCEQLLRLGVAELVVVDPDVLTDHNVSRVYGSTVHDNGRPKVDLVLESAARIGLGSHVTPIHSNVNDTQALEHLRRCDVVLGCTDDNVGRITLSRLAYYYLLPVIDCGVIIDSNGQQVTGVFGRNTVVGPGAACLLCRRSVDHDRARGESMEPGERDRAVADGYLPPLGDADPSVVSYTTLVAAWSVSELLHRLFGLGEGEAPTEILHRLHLHHSAPNRAEQRHGCYCTDVDVIGAGDVTPTLGIAGLRL